MTHRLKDIRNCLKKEIETKIIHPNSTFPRMFHIIYISIIVLLIGVLLNFQLTQNLSSVSLFGEPKFTKTKDGSYFEIPPEVLPIEQTLTIWKFASGLDKNACNIIRRRADEVNDWGVYSNFGNKLPSKDVGLDKLNLPKETAIQVEVFVRNLAKFISSKFLVKLLDKDNQEMIVNGKPSPKLREEDYDRFLILKGTPFVIKYEGTVTGGIGLHKDNADVSFILLLSDPKEFQGGGTYFEAINRTLFLKQGEAIVFPGQMVHGANSVSKGQRYVISGFITISDEYYKMKRLGTMSTMIRLM